MILARMNDQGKKDLIMGKTDLMKKTCPEDAPERIFALCSRLGATRKDLAAAFGVPEKTLINWVYNIPECKKAYREGSWAYTTGQVEKSLVRSAMGYDVIEETRERVVTIDANGDAHEGMKLVKTVKKHIPPNHTSLLFYLCNRAKSDWKNINKIEITGEEGGPVQHAELHMHLSIADLLKQIPDLESVRQIRDGLKTIECKVSDGKR
jgi:hypothetical protein